LNVGPDVVEWVLAVGAVSSLLILSVPLSVF